MHKGVIEMQYCIYLRKSRADAEAELRGEGETLARHEKTLIDLAKKLKLNITAIYKEVVSGETIAARPVVQQLLSEVEQGIWTGVLVMEVERLARGDTIDQGIISQAFKFSKTKIITPIKTYDPENEFDEEYFEFGLFMSRREYKTINRRIQRGRLASVAEGKYIASVAPYGYERVKISGDKGYTLRILPEQADVIRMIFQLYTEGEVNQYGNYEHLGMTKICNKLDELHIKPLIKDKWSRASINDILKNHVYIGKIRWQYRKEIKKVQSGTIIKERPTAKDFLLYDGLHEPIISEEVFYKAQDIMNNKRNPATISTLTLKNPLTGLVYCKKCGQLMTRLAPNNKNPYSTLKCPNRDCDNISAPIYLVEDNILDSLKIWVNNYKLSIEDKEEKHPSNINMKKEAIKKAKNEIATLQRQLESAYDFLEQQIYTTEVFLERSKILTSKINDLNNQVLFLEKSLEKELLREQSKYSLIPKAEKIIDLYDSLDDATQKNELLKDVIERVEYIKTDKNTRGKRDIINFDVFIYPKMPDVDL